MTRRRSLFARRAPADRYQRVRIYQTLRTAHLERAHVQTPAAIFYGDVRYDFDQSLAEGLDLIRCGLWSMSRSLLRSRVQDMEVNEPLMRPGLVRTCLAVAVVRAAGRLRGEPVTVVSYAIENKDPFASAQPRGWKARVRHAVEQRLSRFNARNIDRLVFGTAAAEELYRARLGDCLTTAETLSIPALPAACGCIPDGPRDDDRVVFVGDLSERKGIGQLLQAWPAVVSRHPAARLTVVGVGDLEPLVRQVAETEPSVQLVIDPPRSHIHQELARSSVLVLLSQPRPNWREQVGLPIVEGLAHGCSIVTTTETGLASWLSSHGHEVLTPDSAAAEYADSIVRTLQRRRDRSSVLADLPSIDGRLAADFWLFQEKPKLLRGTIDVNYR